MVEKMKFNKVNKVIINSMNHDEAVAFTKFLISEIARHKMDIDNAIDLIHRVIDKFQIEEELE